MYVSIRVIACDSIAQGTTQLSFIDLPSLFHQCRHSWICPGSLFFSSVAPSLSVTPAFKSIVRGTPPLYIIALPKLNWVLSQVLHPPRQSHLLARQTICSLQIRRTLFNSDSLLLRNGKVCGTISPESTRFRILTRPQLLAINIQREKDM